MSWKARTVSSSYSISAGVSRVTMRQNTQSFNGIPLGCLLSHVAVTKISQKSRNGNVSEGQAEDSQERQPRQARLDLVSQGLPAPSARVGLSSVPSPSFLDRRARGRPSRLRRVAQTGPVA